ncbi:hypothetical protein Taro_003734 [Colocasia esculenta]|uniref:Retrotransposon gag domain-containing protein n=1 Tax=Colocasia esculenta TaxID=4460 RepID=A0A843TMH5_COLES|nr:hypothetical protein [Colocasia esculenta]
MGLKPSLRTRIVGFDHRTLDEALSAACRQEGEMEQYLEEKKASQKRPAATFQRQDKRKTVYQTPQKQVAVSNYQVPSVRSPAMASRGRRGGAPARDDEQRREERAEQQAPAPQGAVLPPPPPVDYGVFMQGLVQFMQTQAHTQAALQAQLEAQAQAPAQDHGGPSIMERFKRMTPPSFKGESDPLLAESWMREIEKIFRAIRCPDEDKVTLATYMLQERADVWWSSLLRTRFEDGAVVVAWDAFVRLFRAKFVPEHVQEKMEQEFLSLTQGSMTVLEYEARFSELSKYAPHIVEDERRKTKKFVMGLKPSLRTRLVAFDHRTLDEALSAACRQEGEMEQYLEEKKASQKRPAATFQRQDKRKTVYQTPQKQVAVSNYQVPSVRSPGVVGDTTPLEETVETDSERGD